MEDCGEKILVVDDDQGCRTLIYELLESAGLPAARAATGEEALAMIRRAAPRLAILDVRLPGVSGYEMCHRLKLERGDAFPVVLVSGERTESSTESPAS